MDGWAIFVVGFRICFSNCWGKMDWNCQFEWVSKCFKNCWWGYSAGLLEDLLQCPPPKKYVSNTDQQKSSKVMTNRLCHKHLQSTEPPPVHEWIPTSPETLQAQAAESLFTAHLVESLITCLAVVAPRVGVHAQQRQVGQSLQELFGSLTCTGRWKEIGKKGNQSKHHFTSLQEFSW